ncbi:DUF5403 family protein [Streptomyces spectabilis]|uniref:HK97 gp10 family phage protein n=1 Tax=Streptomyces spectabilis TaxID=68270 RepID=A0A516RFA2_STRST|nr:DUF5403 family protein [Streptomyces spectabilis]QDQ14325.1 hypothetical protein FH965_30240 [Streptomyces spectabilis]
MARLRRNIGKRVASLPGVNDAIREEAIRRAYKIRSAASMHRDTGDFQSSIKVVKASGQHRRQDWLVTINDRNAVSINWGHIDSKTGRPVRGIHAIEKGIE